MDPDTTLAMLRDEINALADLCTKEEALNAEGTLSDIAFHASNVVDEVRALDRWLSRGGSLPRAWGGFNPA